MNHEVKKGRLLDENGEVIEAGFAYSLVKEYNRDHIKAKKSRIKEWDYYYIGNDEYGIALTIDDNSYMGLASVSFLNFKEKWECTRSVIKWFTNGSVKLPSSSKIGDVSLKGKDFSLEFFNDGKKRHLVCEMKNVKKGKDFSCDVTLLETNESSMVIVTPFDKPKHFYYNQKINCLKAQGHATFDNKTYSLDNCYGVLDWGRGVWTYKNTWYWSSLSSVSNGVRIGWNLGYGFGNTKAASENMFFYNDKAYKLDDVSFNIPTKDGKDDFMSPWTFTSKDGKINMTFRPIIDRYSGTDVIIIKSIQHQVFGLFSGYIYAGEEKIEFENLLGFAEKVKNYW